MIQRIRASLLTMAFLSLIAFAALIFFGVVGGIVYTLGAIGSPPYGLLTVDRWKNDSPVAFLSMLATFLTAAVSFVAAWILWATLIKLREANQIFLDEQRAWLAFESRIAGKIERRAHPESKRLELRVRLEVDVTNRGRLPAEGVNCQYAVAVSDKRLFPSFENVPLANVDISNVIAPGSKSTVFLSTPIRWTEVERAAPFPSDEFLPGIKLLLTYSSGALRERHATTELRLYRKGNDGSFPRITTASLPLNPNRVYIRQKDGPAT